MRANNIFTSIVVIIFIITSNNNNSQINQTHNLDVKSINNRSPQKTNSDLLPFFDEDSFHIIGNGNLLINFAVNINGNRSCVDLDPDYFLSSQPLVPDMCITMTCGSDCFIIMVPTNGALNYATESNNINDGNCFTSISNYRNSNNPHFSDGNIICILTNEYNIGLIRYISHSSSNNVLTFNFDMIVFGKFYQGYIELQ